MSATEIARSQGLRQRTNIKNLALDDISLKRKSIDVVLSKEGLMSVQDKRLLLAKLRAAMKPGGQLMLTDFLLTGPTDSRIYEVWRSEEHTSELQSLMRISYAVFCLKKKTLNIHLPNTSEESVNTQQQ